MPPFDITSQILFFAGLQKHRKMKVCIMFFD